jgi:AAA+ superfamily predicted ATPase
MSNEYDTFFPHPQKGFSSVEAASFLSKTLPQYTGWIHWNSHGDNTSYTAMRAVGLLINRTNKKKGTIGSWEWTRIKTSYPDISYWSGQNDTEHSGWTGVIQFVREDGKQFILFSFLSSIGTVGYHYLAYTVDTKILSEFCNEVFKLTQKHDNMVLVRVWGGTDFELTQDNRSKLFLHANIEDDIMRQALSFFESKSLYDKLGVSYRRGLLFSGPPGNGKTAMTRHLLRECYKRFGAQPWVLNITRTTDEYDLNGIFHEASNTEVPGLVILEDMDSLTTESNMTRTGLLAQLDGINPKEGILIVGTTNNPGDIDPALAQRPSRFDRVWEFSPPDASLRKSYLEYVFPGSTLVDRLVKDTKGWSFAYLNELRITAAFISIRRESTTVTNSDIEKALELLLAQFNVQRG